ncbi:hypothetical protein BS17DRAFT_774039 [Gyrodon lividus]|nr:hypothetical protein BS17DRAFT_774039 [Gyrodon lividus]
MSNTSTIEDPESQQSTLKKARLTLPAEDIQPAADVGSLPPNLLLTPPKTTRRTTHRQPGEGEQEPRPQPVTPEKHNEKERENAQFGLIEDQANHSHRTGSSVRASRPSRENDVLPLFTRSRDSSISSNDLESPTNADNVVDYVDGVKARVNALTEYMDSFDIVQAARYLQTIERQKPQYEHKNQSQKTRIEELMAEKERLIAEVSRLKEDLRLQVFWFPENYLQPHS